ncbi:MAG: sugar ABC transporter substrate-binding protein [Planctomycetota bacterium]|jgi:ABC-type sugar transport system substrate-binding protein
MTFYPGPQIAVLLIICILLPTVGCDEGAVTEEKPTTNAQADAGKGFIAFVGAGPHNPLWPIIKNGAQRYKKNVGILEFRYFSPKGNSPQDQIELLNSLKDPQMRGLCIHIIDTKAVGYQLEQIYTRGVVIVSIINPAPEQIRAGHVAFDNEKIGRELARITVEALDGVGSIMMLHAGHDHPIYGPRLTAFTKALAGQTKIDIYAAINCDADSGEAREIIRKRSERFPRLSAWVSLDDWPLRETRNTKSLFTPGCKFITFGGTPAHWPLIRNGTSPAIVSAHYRFLGYKAAQFCETEVRHESRFKNYYSTPLRIIRSTNLDEYIRDWIYWSTGSYTKKGIVTE